MGYGWTALCSQVKLGLPRGRREVLSFSRGADDQSGGTGPCKAPRGEGVGDTLLRRKDWCLLVLAAAQGAPLQPVQLQKSLFLIGENVKPVESGLSVNFYAFEPYDYGPFDSNVYADAEELQREGLAYITQHPHRSYRQYAATNLGLQRANEIESRLPAGVCEYVRSVVQWALPRSFNEIVRTIYRQYPAQRARSVFNG